MPIPITFLIMAGIASTISVEVIFEKIFPRKSKRIDEENKPPNDNALNKQ